MLNPANMSFKVFFILTVLCAFDVLGSNIKLSELPSPPKADPTQCQLVPNQDKLDCFPQGNANQEDCEARGCCWSVPSSLGGLPNIPYCFYQPNAPSYVFKNITEVPNGVEAILERTNKSPYPRDVSTIKLVATYQSDSILRVKIIDPVNQRFETPFPVVELPSPSTQTPLYRFSIEKTVPGFRIIRRSDNVTIFDASNLANFIYSDQFLQLTTKLPSKNIYGLGEQRKRFKLSTDWSQLTLFNHDAAPQPNINIYGSHPFYLLVENSTKANGVFLKNSNGMELVLQSSPALTYRAIGGILDFYIFLGPTPSDVLKQYQEIIGKPKMPPFWSLGFHLCRWGINDLNTTKVVLKRNLDAGVFVVDSINRTPLSTMFDICNKLLNIDVHLDLFNVDETQWNDLDYMENHNDFTYDKNTFAGLPEFVKELHSQGRRYVILIDPGVSGSEAYGSYPPYDRGVELDVFVKNSSDGIFVGKVWNPVSTVFPDFTHPNAYAYWKQMLKEFHDIVPFDGAWIDMNEPSNSEFPYGCPESELETPPYLPNIDGGNLKVKTFCMTAKQYLGVHYNVHNLYGISEANITSRALSEILGERSLIITRSSFAGQGRYGGHWGGDVYSTWDELRYSIPHLLDFSLFGIPLMGSDICGFNDDTTEDLCNRWMQLGSFYPFSRNHNSELKREQDPAAMGEQVLRSSIKALTIRYTLLPYLYTLFWQANQEGTTVARPLVVEFPEDPNTYDIDTTFLWGSALLIAPVLENDPASISVYLPEGIWYNFYNREPLKSKGESFDIKTDKDTIPLFIRGGQIIPMQFAANTTEEVRNSDLRILGALNENGTASGQFYWDDGVSVDVGDDYTLLKFHASNGIISITAENVGKTPPPKLFSAEILGLDNEVTSIELTGNQNYTFKYNDVNKSILIENLNIVEFPATIKWH